jgi:hypothetical protein
MHGIHGIKINYTLNQVIKEKHFLCYVTVCGPIRLNYNYVNRQGLFVGKCLLRGNFLRLADGVNIVDFCVSTVRILARARVCVCLRQ